MKQKTIVLDAQTGKITEIEVDVEVQQPVLEDVQNEKMTQLMNLYKDTIVVGFESSATGVPIFFSYSQQDQLNYSKWANVFALNPAKESVIIGSVSNGVVTMTKEQFILFMDDAENYEVGLYTKRKGLETQINNATTVDELNQINISL